MVCVTESWLKSRLPDSCIADTNIYSVWRSDRLERSGGGTCIVTRDSTVVATKVLVSCDIGGADLCAVDLNCHNMSIRLINVYLPPTSDTGTESIAALKKLLHCLVQLCSCNLAIV